MASYFYFLHSTIYKEIKQNVDNFEGLHAFLELTSSFLYRLANDPFTDPC